MESRQSKALTSDELGKILPYGILESRQSNRPRHKRGVDILPYGILESRQSSSVVRVSGSFNFALWDFGIKAKPGPTPTAFNAYFALWDFGIKAKPDPARIPFSSDFALWDFGIKAKLARMRQHDGPILPYGILESRQS